MHGFSSKELSLAILALLGTAGFSSTTSAQGYPPPGYAVVGYQPVVVPLTPVVIAPAPLFYTPSPVVAQPVIISPAPIVQTSYYAPAPAPPVGVVKERINPGLFGQMNYRVKGVDPCLGPFKQHSRVGWAGYSYRARTW